jgi:hypothetical protein
MTEILAGWAVFQIGLIWVATWSAENATRVRHPQEQPLAAWLIGPVRISLIMGLGDRVARVQREYERKLNYLSYWLAAQHGGPEYRRSK